MYYTINNRTDKEVGNVFPQVSCLTQAQAHCLHSDEFPKTEPKLIFELLKNAKLTDLLSQAAISSNGLLVSERFKNILNGFNLIHHKFYPAVIKTAKGDYSYFWLHLVDTNSYNAIDFKRSEFYFTQYELQQSRIDIDSFEHYEKLKKENGVMWAVDIEIIKLNPSFDMNLDLFEFLPFSFTRFISQRLRDTLIQNNITGTDINVANNIIVA